MTTSNEVVDYLWNVIGPICHLDPKYVAHLGTLFQIPCFDPSDILALCTEATAVLKTRSCLIDLHPPVYIVGDVHGDLHDLLRILTEIGDFEERQIVFLGDYIDRGAFSLEVVVFLFTLLCKFPRSIILLRGNHEFPRVYHCTSLQDDLQSLYRSSDLFDKIQSVFTYLPLAALIGGTHLCLHGGISPHLRTLDDIRRIQLPILDCSLPLVADILWSDPSKTAANFVDSDRGCGVLFGATALSTFLRANSLRLLIRGHQCVYEGTEMFKDLALTVFSTSYYNSDEENKAAYVLLQEDGEIEVHDLAARRSVRRGFAQFGQVPPRDPAMKRPPGRTHESEMRLGCLRLVGLSREQFLKQRRSLALADGLALPDDDYL